MTSEPLILNTLRKLMRPRTVLRATYNVSHAHDTRSSQFTLELAQGTGQELSIIELCKDGEFVAGHKLPYSGKPIALDEAALTRAMDALWGESTDHGIDNINAIHAICVLTNIGDETPAKLLQGWNYRTLPDGGMLEVWSDTAPQQNASILRPKGLSMRAAILSLQHQAVRIRRDSHYTPQYQAISKVG